MPFSGLPKLLVAKTGESGRRRRRFRSLGSAGLLGAVVGGAVLVAPQVASAEPHLKPAPTSTPQAHDVAGFPGTATTAPFNECPAIGFNNSCGLVIVVSNNGVQVLQDTNNGTVPNPTPGTQLPYDQADDTLVGVVNLSSKPLYALQLSGSQTGTPIFGFEGDGICTYATGGSNTNGGSAGGGGTPLPGAGGYTGDSYCSPAALQGSAAASGPDPNGIDYQGPSTTFTNISSDTTTRLGDHAPRYARASL